MPGLPAVTVVLALATVASAQTYTLPLGATATGTVTDGGALTFQVVANGPVTWTHLDFRLGLGTQVGANAYVDIWLCTWGEAAARFGATNTLIGTTVPVSASGVVGQAVVVPIVPVAPFASVTLPSAHPFGITLVAHNCSLQTTTGTLASATAQMQASGGAQFVSPPSPAQPVWSVNQRHLTGAIHYTLAGTPMNLSEMLPFGAGCGGLTVAASGNAALGQTVSLTTVPATAAPSFGVNMVSLESLLGVGPNGMDLGIVGMPGCGLLLDHSIGVLSTIGNHPAVPASTTYSFTIPNVPFHRGMVLWSQSAWVEPGLNTLGMSISNGVRIRIW